MQDPSSALFRRTVRYRESLSQMIGAAALMLCVLPMTVVVWAVAASAV